ncbi:MBL fold metallo-hydrolase [Rodentibacter genomosp. 1]|uniref:MBL fold metallo-hydrolase n=1 Tax=Rodentibacter genomosp. 1 TaxID=1908264 RepID=A0A1V3J2P4_9PAST|nr:MBL fold metallo-hydrolase [Rodentibacter genomosp. 1]OOF48996.1 MBL fold metallo-hydrolase [Rodentibacter genomosp. 1]
MNKKLVSLFTGTVLAVSMSAAFASPIYTPAKNIVPMQLTQVPGYYRVMLGDFEVTALYDGTASLDSALFANYSRLSQEELEAMINHEFSPRTSTGGVDTAIIAFLINTGENLILVDAGKGDVQAPIFIDEKGILLQSLEAAGYKAEQIDIILPTHMHADHFSGVTLNGKMVFPNATIYLSNQEKSFWLDTAMDKISENAKPFVQWSRDAAAPYLKANKVKFYNAGDEVIPNVKSIPLFGHTPGHSGFIFESKGKKMLVWGDLMHNHAIQMKHPEVAVDFDADSISARKSRMNMLPEIVKDKMLVAGAHLPFPGLGHLKAEREGGYRWIPVEYRIFRKN